MWVIFDIGRLTEIQLELSGMFPILFKAARMSPGFDENQEVPARVTDNALP